MLRGVLEVLKPYEAGRRVEDLSRRIRVVAKLNSNENPYTPPPKVLRAIREALKEVNRYPDSSYGKLKLKLSHYTGLPVECISVGCGASEVLENICKATLEPWDRVVIPVPGYTMHIFLSMIRDVHPVYVKTEDRDFKVTAEDVLSASKKAKLVFLCSPNNPTGMTIDKREILDIVENTRALVVVDEAYYEYCGQTIADKVVDYDNLVVVRSMSKFYGLAGLRVGYALANRKIAQSLEKVRLPFGISIPAAEAAVEALESIPAYEEIKAKILRERERVSRELEGIDGLKVYSSAANFVFVGLPKNSNSKKIVDSLLAMGVMVRDVSQVPGLSSPHLRITIGKTTENKVMISALKKLFTHFSQ